MFQLRFFGCWSRYREIGVDFLCMFDKEEMLIYFQYDILRQDERDFVEVRF